MGTEGTGSGIGKSVRRRIVVALLVVLSTTVVFAPLGGCGKDGKDGKSYISLVWQLGTYLRWLDNNPAWPGTIYYGQYYQTSAATYRYDYTAINRRWIGTYTITIDKGSSGKMFSDGSDGKDRYFRFGAYWGGPQFTYTERAANDAGSARVTMQPGPAVDESVMGEETTRVYSDGEVTITLKFREVK